MTEFRIPGNVTDARTTLAELGALSTATEWSKAAIVSCLVSTRPRKGRPRGGGKNATFGILSPTEFSKLRIHGLKSPMTVRKYWRMWFFAWHEGLAKPCRLGDIVELPTVDWTEFCETHAEEADPEESEESEDQDKPEEKQTDWARLCFEKLREASHSLTKAGTYAGKVRDTIGFELGRSTTS
jgi:hypothetical protein